MKGLKTVLQAIIKRMEGLKTIPQEVMHGMKGLIRIMEGFKMRRSAKVAFILIISFVALYYNILSISPQSSLRGQAMTESLSGPNAVIPPKCIMNKGKPVVHENDPVLKAQIHGEIDEIKYEFDSHQVPDIETIGPSFYFETSYTRAPGGGRWPCVSRAWNETYKIIDDISVTHRGKEIWGAKGLSDELVRKAMDPNKRTSKITILEPGKYATFSGWFAGNFGHYVHDTVSKIAWLKSLVSEDTKFILPHMELHEKILRAVDEKFVRDRVVWIQYFETVFVQEGSLTVMKPKSNKPFIFGYPQTASVYTEQFRRWLEESHWSSNAFIQAENKDKIIFYRRKGSTPFRVLDDNLEALLIQKLLEVMKQRGKSEDDLIIFSGKDENGKTMSLDDQFRLFSSASVAIGPHGSGLTNIIWMDPRCNSKHRPKVIEFVSSPRTPDVQVGSLWGYWWLYGSLPWIDYHQIYYSENSTGETVYIDPQMFEETIKKVI